MAQRDDKDRQQQQGSTGQRSAGQGGGHRQGELPADHGGQLGGKAGLGGSGERGRQEGKRPPGAEDRSGGEQQRQQGPQGDSRGAEGDQKGRGARVTQGNLGTTQRDWTQRDNTADSDEE